MPFITQSQRSIIDPTLDEAINEIQTNLIYVDADPLKAGVLAYIIYRTMLHFIGTVSWGNLSRVYTDVVLGAGAYFKRDLIDVYEAEKKAENGAIEL